MALIPVSEYTPDSPDYGAAGTGEALNVIPDIRSYRPLSSYSTYSTTALTARCQGAYYTRGSDGTSRNFSGDATKLYALDNSTPTQWNNVSRLAGGAYACPSDGAWRFTQFGTLVIAVNDADSPQKYDVDSAANFSILGGSPPAFKYIAVVKDFVVGCSTSANRRLVQWSGIDNAETWTQSQTTMSDTQTIPEGGRITGIIGGEYGLIFLEDAIYRMTFVGPPVIFQFDRIAVSLGCSIDGSLCALGTTCFFYNRKGFFRLDDGATLSPIGEHKVNRAFATDLDTGNVTRTTSAIDPVNKIYYISYPGSGNTSGTPNKGFIHNFDVGRWSHAAPGDLELVYSGATQASVTLEGLDAINTSVDALPYSLDSSIYAGSATALLAAFGTDHKSGYFNGTNLAATVDTDEVQPFDGQRCRIRSARPMVDGSAQPTLAVGSRAQQSDAVSYGSDIACQTNGKVALNVNARYLRGRIKMAAGASWNHILGVDEIQANKSGTL